MTHLEELVSLGFLVGEDARESIEKLNKKDFEKAVKHFKEEKPFIITKEMIEIVLAKEIEMVKQFETKDVFTVQDYVEALNKRYGFLQDLLVKKVELKNIVSISKVSSGNVSVIGMVKDIVEKSGGRTVVLEDPTGYIDVVMDRKLVDRLVLDDVIAVFGLAKNKTLFAEKMLFPSIPLRPVNLSEKSIKVAFTDKKVDADYIVSKKNIQDMIKKKKYDISSPCIFKIGDITILVLVKAKSLEVLNKRYFNNDRIDFLIEPAPDIIFTDEDVNMSYKGISIVPKDNIIDLKTRKVEKIGQVK
ncbi:MAG: hypothetical protein V1818_01175 [Candidatus Aenigmatarchaeota archaeon]